MAMQALLIATVAQIDLQRFQVAALERGEIGGLWPLAPYCTEGDYQTLNVAKKQIHTRRQ
jgi:hypothetical protein